MGLLDTVFGSGPNDPRTQAMGLLSAGLLRGDFGGGLLAANQHFAQEPERQMRRQIQEMQLRGMQEEAMQRQQAAEMARRQREALPGLFRQPGVTGGQAQFPTVGGEPMFSKPVQAGHVSSTPGGFDVMGAIQAGFSPEQIKAYAGLSDIGRSKVARTVEVDDGKGGKATMQLDEFGQPVGSPLAGYIAPVQVNQGDRVSFVRPNAGVSLPVGMSPSERDASARGWAGVNLQRQNAEQGKWQYDSERGGLVNLQSGEFRPAMQGGVPVGPKNKEMTDSQAKANLFGTRAQEADKILSGLQGKYWPTAVNAKMGAEGIPMIGGAAGAVGNLMLTAEGQQAEQAQRDYINAILRRESGAVISPGEFANAQRQYFPQPGDSAKVIEQKARNRRIAIEGVLAEVPQQRRGVPALNNPSGGASGSWNTNNAADPLGIR